MENSQKRKGTGSGETGFAAGAGASVGPAVDSVLETASLVDVGVSIPAFTFYGILPGYIVPLTEGGIALKNKYATIPTEGQRFRLNERVR